MSVLVKYVSVGLLVKSLGKKRRSFRCGTDQTSQHAHLVRKLLCLGNSAVGEGTSKFRMVKLDYKIWVSVGGREQCSKPEAEHSQHWIWKCIGARSSAKFIGKYLSQISYTRRNAAVQIFPEDKQVIVFNA